MEALRGGLHKGPVFLACAFDTGQCLGIFGLGRFEGLKVGCFLANRDQSRRVYAPVPAQHQLENWLRAASSTNSFFAAYADARRTLLVTSKVDSGGRQRA